MKTIEASPARAAWAATELARLPVEAQADHLEPELAGLGQRHRDDPVLERSGGVGRVVLEPQLPEPQLRSQTIRPHERGPPGPQVDRGAVSHREQVSVPPHREGARGDPLPRDLAATARSRRPPPGGRSRSRTRGAPRQGIDAPHSRQRSPVRWCISASSSVGHWHLVLPRSILSEAPPSTLVAAASLGPSLSRSG